MRAIQILKDGKMDEIECKFTKKNILKNLSEISHSQGNNSIKLLYTWNYNSNDLLCYGWYDGEAGFENKHDLPPCGKSSFLETDSSEQLLFGDIFIVKKENKYSDLNISEYCDFYNFAFAGFDDCESSDSENINTEEEDEDYNPNETDEDDEEEIIEFDNTDDLEEDNNEY